MPCRCTQIKKVPLPGKAGAYQYTFKCVTSDGRVKHAQLAEKDDTKARRLAEIKCDQVTARE
jgi:hypothetical protein